MNLIFLNYGLLNGNSGGHIAHFANELAKQGHDVCVIGEGEAGDADDYGPRLFDVFLTKDCEGEDLPEELVKFASSRNALLHVWTPRQNVISVAEKIIDKTGVKYVVHLEDNEEVLLAENLGVDIDTLRDMDPDELDASVPKHLSHPIRATEFLERAKGISIIVEKLADHCPKGVATHVLEPGVDSEEFAPNLEPELRANLRKELYIEDSSFVLFYHGNMHAANKDEIFSLYTAVLLLRRREHDVVLIRAGRNFVENMDPSFAYLNGDWVINLGFLDRARMIEVAKLADGYVQPGSPGPFNDYRMPSKVPEFLALGRPVLLPNTNIGLSMTDGTDAMLLKMGDGTEIANRLEEILDLPEKRSELGAGARTFALTNLDWSKNAAALSTFYQSL